METYLAIIEGTATPDDFRLTVRPLPEMKRIMDISALPRFPYFYGNKAYTGKVGELVWIIANDEFTMGYVMGLVSKYSWEGNYTSQSITTENFEKIRDAYLTIKDTMIPFSDLEITYWDNTCIHAVDRRDGKLIIGYSSGSINIIGKDEVLFMVAGDTVDKNSIIKMTKDTITIKAETLYVNGEEVFLGRYSYGPVVVTQGNDANVFTGAKGVYA